MSENVVSTPPTTAPPPIIEMPPVPRAQVNSVVSTYQRLLVEANNRIVDLQVQVDLGRDLLAALQKEHEELKKKIPSEPSGT